MIFTMSYINTKRFLSYTTSIEHYTCLHQYILFYYHYNLMHRKLTSNSEPSTFKKAAKLTINTNNTKYKVVRDAAKSLRFNITKQDEWDLCWIDTNMTTDRLHKMKPYQKINHFPGMSAVARKNFLGKNLLKMKKIFPAQYSFFPPTWLLPSDWVDFKAQFTDKKTKTFIVKPEASCQGQGIFLTRTLADLKPGDHYVVQRYVHKPYLIDGLKFDLRIYALILGCDPMRIYIYNEGLARFATEPYVGPQNGNLNNMYMHLTNYAINKNSNNFIFNDNEERTDIGHKRSLASIWKSIDQNGGYSKSVINEIEKIIVKTMCSVQPSLQNTYRSCQCDGDSGTRCFEILGFDILLDYKLKPWVLEVNHTPSFCVDTPFDYKVKFDLISNAIRLLNFNLERRISYKRQQQQPTNLSRIAEKQSLKTMKPQWKEEGFEVNEKENIGNFKIAYPNPFEEYDKFVASAKETFDEFYGGHKKVSQELPLTKINKISVNKRSTITRYNCLPLKTNGLDKHENEDVPYESPKIIMKCEDPFEEHKQISKTADNRLSAKLRRSKLSSIVLEYKSVIVPKRSSALISLLKSTSKRESQSTAKEKSIRKDSYNSLGIFLCPKLLEFFPQIGLTPMKYNSSHTRGKTRQYNE